MPEDTLIYVVGSSNTDMVVKSGRLPAPGETVLGGEFLMNAGGKGANQAVAAARLGGKVYFVCKTGNDLFGRQAIQQFSREGIFTDYVATDPILPSGVALINVDTNGENSISVAPGANAALSNQDVTKALSQLKPGDLVLVQLEIPLEVVRYVTGEGIRAGARVILNPAPARKLDRNILSKLYLITPNESEAEFLTGIRVTDHGTAEKASKILRDAGCENVIITLGAKGAYLNSGDISMIAPTVAVTPVDTTAAGDCFNGALAVALAEGKHIQSAVEFACKAAAISTTILGAQSSLPTREVVDAPVWMT